MFFEKRYIYSKLIYGDRDETPFTNLDDAIKIMRDDFWNNMCARAAVLDEKNKIAYSIYDEVYIKDLIDGYEYINLDPDPSGYWDKYEYN